MQGLWKHRDFRKLWIGQAVSQTGSRISREGLPLTAVLLLGATPMQMGLLNGISGAAILLTGLYAGIWADRVRRRPLMIAADLGRCCVLASVPVAASFGQLAMPQLYAVALAAGALNVLFDVGYQSYLPGLVSHASVLEGNSKLALTESTAEIVGPGLTGVLVQTITAPMAILFDALSFLVSALSLGLITKAEPPPCAHANPNIWREAREGLAAAWDDDRLRALLRHAATSAFAGGFIASMYIVFSIRELGLTAALLGVMISIGGISSLFGALCSEGIARRFGIGPTLIGAALLSGTGSLLLAVAHGPVWMCAAFVAASQALDMGWLIFSVNEVTLRQSLVPNRLLGRVNSARLLLFQGLLPIGALAGGALAGTYGIRATMLTGACGLLASSLWLIFSPVRSMKTIPANTAVTSA